MMKFYTGLLVFVGVFAFAIIGAILHGWAFSILWSWFIVPVFMAPSLSVIQAIGISLAIRFGMIGYKKPESGKEFTELMSDMITSQIVYPFMGLGLGWIVLQFM